MRRGGSPPGRLRALAFIAAARGDWQWMFVWLGVALAVDTIDGPLTRHLRVTTVLPRWSGERLDLIVDFLTYVAVPGLRLNPSGPPHPRRSASPRCASPESGQFTLCAAWEPHERGLWPWTSEGGYAISSGVKAARANPPQRNDDRFPGRSACLGKLHCLERRSCSGSITSSSSRS
jgi:hypothetical protein